MMMNEQTAAGTVSRLIREADSVYGNSKYVSETVEEQFVVRPAGEVYDGVDRRFFFPPADRMTKSKIVVLYAGSFQPRKRVELVIEQAATWPEAEFRLAGRGVTEAGCRTIVRRRGCRNVVFLGHLSPAQLGEEMRSADIFLFPSVLEGHPQVLIQAAACGLPSVAMSLYRPDSIAHGRTGFLADSDKRMAEYLALLLRDSDLRRKMSAAAVEHTRQFDWDRVARQWEGIFQQAYICRNEHGRSRNGH